MPINFLQAFRLAFGEHDLAVIQTILDDVYRSPPFVRSDRLTNLLRYLIAEELAGKGRRLGAYSIAMDVYGRGENFDPSTDSLIRVEMHRLRTALERWDADQSNNAQYRLEFARGSYRPTLKPRDAAPNAGEAVPREARRFRQFFPFAALTIALVVVGLIWWPPNPGSATCASLRPTLSLPDHVADMPAEQNDRFMRHLRADIAAYRMITAYEGAKAPCSGIPDFILTLQWSASGKPHITMTVRSRSSGKDIRSETYPLQSQAGMDGITLASARISFLLGHFHGQIPLEAVRERWGNRRSEVEFHCLLSAKEFLASHVPTEFRPVRKCLTETMRSSKNADIAGALAAIELWPRFRANTEPDGDNERRFDDAVAVGDAIDPMDATLLIAKLRHAATYPTNDNMQVRNLLDRIATLYPNHPLLLTEMATIRVRNFGEDKKSEELMNRARAIIGPEADMRWPVIFHNLESGVWRDRSLVAGLRDDSFYLSQLVRIDVGRYTNDRDMIDRAKAKIRAGSCSSPGCLRNRTEHEGFYLPIERRLLKLIDKNL